MPVYDYLCDTDSGGCGHRFDLEQGYHDSPKKKCPACKKFKLRKVYGNPGLVFVGSGFYINDYAKSERQSKEA